MELIPSPLIRFENDYSDGAHPKVLEALIATNHERTNVYGEDYHCDEARSIIKRLCQSPRAAVHFLPGGTITNVTLLTSALRPYQGIVSSEVGHIHVHETGAIEARGHKILTLPALDGKITAEAVRRRFDSHYVDPDHEHTVMPGIVYITNPTEYGAIYQKEELKALSEVCRACGLYLYLDGARLGYALTAEHNDLTLADLASLCDAFSIGGTKHGALFGEALVITNDHLKANFRYSIKQSGALTAKGRLLGVQFTALLEDGLYFDTAREANRQAIKIRDALLSLGYRFFCESETNQQFPIFPDRELNALSERYSFSTIEKLDNDETCIRICTNYATREEDIDALLEDIKKLHNT